jgi:hypothetical protein
MRTRHHLRSRNTQTPEESALWKGIRAQLSERRRQKRHLYGLSSNREADLYNPASPPTTNSTQQSHPIPLQIFTPSPTGPKHRLIPTKIPRQSIPTKNTPTATLFNKTASGFRVHRNCGVTALCFSSSSRLLLILSAVLPSSTCDRRIPTITHTIDAAKYPHAMNNSGNHCFPGALENPSYHSFKASRSSLCVSR